jgi:hypothetical protein
MLIDKVDYQSFHEIESNIMEIIVNEGEEINEERVDQTHKILYEKYNSPYAVLINRINTYSHTRDSLIRISKQKNAVAFAIVIYNTSSRITAKIHNLFQSNVEVFDDKQNAIGWLRAAMSEYNKKPI